MPHHIYTTRAFVLSSHPSGEANRVFNLLTEELGMVRASAQGVREEKSKLRFSLQDHHQVLVSLVRGRESWRIVGAEELTDLPFFESEQKEYIARFFKFLQLFIHGEGKIGNLIEDIVKSLSLLARLKKSDDQANLEVILKLRALKDLGYLEARVPLEPYLEGAITLELVTNFGPERREALEVIDQVVMGSGL